MSDELRLEPLDDQAGEQRKLVREVPLPPYSEPVVEKKKSEWQFSIRSVLVLMAFVALVTAICQWFPPAIGIVAGVFGGVALLGLLALLLFRPTVHLRLIWLVVLVLYVVAAIVAVYISM